MFSFATKSGITLVPLALFLALPVMTSNCSSTSKHDSSKAGYICALDMGSNTFKFIIAEMKDGRYIEHIEQQKDVLGIGDDIARSQEQTGKLEISQEKLSEIESTVRKYKKVCDKHLKDPKIYGVATAAFRQASNREEFVDLMEKLNVEVEIATPERESQLAYEATVFGKPNQAVVDCGSRSTELVSFTSGKYIFEEFPTGYRTAFQTCFSPANSFEFGMNSYLGYLESIIGIDGIIPLINQDGLHVIEGVEMAKFVFGLSREKVEGLKIKHSEIKKKIKKLSEMSSKKYKKFKLKPDMDKVLPRLVLLDYLMDLANYDEARFTLHELNAGIVS